MVSPIFSQRLSELLDYRGAQKWLAVEADTTEATISRYMRGETQPELNIVVRIAKALGVSVDYLSGLTDSRVPRESLGEEIILLLKCYEAADERDKKVLWTILDRYIPTGEKRSATGSNPTNAKTTKTG